MKRNATVLVAALIAAAAVSSVTIYYLTSPTEGSQVPQRDDRIREGGM